MIAFANRSVVKEGNRKWAQIVCPGCGFVTRIRMYEDEDYVENA